MCFCELLQQCDSSELCAGRRMIFHKGTTCTTLSELKVSEDNKLCNSVFCVCSSSLSKLFDFLLLCITSTGLNPADSADLIHTTCFLSKEDDFIQLI